MQRKKYHNRSDGSKVGEDSEIEKAVSRLSELGYNVWESCDDDTYTDLIVERSDNKLNRIKIYEGNLKRQGECVECNFDSNYIESNGLNQSRDRLDEIDAVIIYCDINQKFYWVDIDETCGQGVILNIGENRVKGSNGKIARNYEL